MEQFCKTYRDAMNPFFDEAELRSMCGLSEEQMALLIREKLFPRPDLPAQKLWRKQPIEDLLGALRFHRPLGERRGAVVYFVAIPKFIKIGFTTDVQGRLKTLQCALPYRLNLLGTFPVGSESREQAIHYICRSRRVTDEDVGTEWFKATPGTMLFIWWLHELNKTLKLAA